MRVYGLNKAGDIERTTSSLPSLHTEIFGAESAISGV